MLFKLKVKLFLTFFSTFFAIAIRKRSVPCVISIDSICVILQDEVAKLRGGMALDFSLEKSRIKEEVRE